jgi:hypothetical protein
VAVESSLCRIGNFARRGVVPRSSPTTSERVKGRILIVDGCEARRSLPSSHWLLALGHLGLTTNFDALSVPVGMSRCGGTQSDSDILGYLYELPQSGSR